MERADTVVGHRSDAGDDPPTGEPSVSSALEHLVAGSQGMITKRVDLALLEGQELLSRSIERAALLGAGMVLAAAAWFAGAWAFVLFVTPDVSPIIRLAGFGLLNGAGAVAFLLLAMQQSRPPKRVRQNGNGATLQSSRLPIEGN